MKKKLVSAFAICFFAVGSAALGCCPCSAGYIACTNAGGSHTVCFAGFEACINTLYPK